MSMIGIVKLMNGCLRMDLSFFIVLMILGKLLKEILARMLEENDSNA